MSEGNPTKPLRRYSRRDVLRRVSATASTVALIAAARVAFPGGAHVAEAAGPETTKAKLGFIALTDAAPLFVAKEKGIFTKYGVPEVDVQKQASWGTTRDNLVLGSEGNGIDGAHILTPMPYLISAGKVTQNNQLTPMYILGSTANASRSRGNISTSRLGSTHARSRPRSKGRGPPGNP